MRRDGGGRSRATHQSAPQTPSTAQLHSPARAKTATSTATASMESTTATAAPTRSRAFPRISLRTPHGRTGDFDREVLGKVDRTHLLHRVLEDTYERRLKGSAPCSFTEMRLRPLTSGIGWGPLARARPLSAADDCGGGRPDGLTVGGGPTLRTAAPTKQPPPCRRCVRVRERSGLYGNGRTYASSWCWCAWASSPRW